MQSPLQERAHLLDVSGAVVEGRLGAEVASEALEEVGTLPGAQPPAAADLLGEAVAAGVDHHHRHARSDRTMGDVHQQGGVAPDCAVAREK